MQRSQRSQLAHEKNDRRRAGEGAARAQPLRRRRERAAGRRTHVRGPRVRKASTTADACRSRQAESTAPSPRSLASSAGPP